MQSGSVEITPGKVFNEQDGETVDLEKLNRMIRDAVLRVAEKSITAREIADNTITSDQLAGALSAQLGLPDGSVTLGKLAAGFVLPLAKGGSGVTTQSDGQDLYGIAANASQVVLTGTNSVYNNSSEVVEPEEGVRGDDEAFWLVKDDNGTEAVVSITPRKINSKVMFNCVVHVDTNNKDVGVGLKLQRSTDGGSSWTDLGLGDASGTRVRVTFTVGHAHSQRSVSAAHYTFIDEPGIAGEVQYRLLYTAHPGYYIYLNRDFNLDSLGDAGAAITAVYRCSSVLNVQELWIP